MHDDIRVAKITTNPRFENANFKFYQEIIPKAAKMKGITTWKQLKGNENLKNVGQTRLGGEFWAGYVITHKIYSPYCCYVKVKTWCIFPVKNFGFSDKKGISNRFIIERAEIDHFLCIPVAIARIKVVSNTINVYIAQLSYVINGLNPGVSVVRIVWSSGWRQFEKELLLVTDVWTIQLCPELNATIV